MNLGISPLAFTHDWNIDNAEHGFTTYEADESRVRADIQMLHDEAKNYINNVLTPALESMSAADLPEDVYGNVQTAINTLKSDMQTVVVGQLPDDSVTAAKLRDDSVTTDKIDDLAVTTDKIRGGAVTEAKIGPGAVTETKLGPGAVTTDKLGTGAVRNTNVSDEVRDAYKQVTMHNVEVNLTRYTGDSPYDWEDYLSFAHRIGNNPGIVFFEIIIRESGARPLRPGSVGYVSFGGNAAFQPKTGSIISVTAHPETRILAPAGAGINDVFHYLDVSGSETVDSKPVIALNVRANSAANKEMYGIVLSGFYVCEGAV